MGVSTDYDLDSVEAFKGTFPDVMQVVDGGTVIKTVDVMMKYQAQESALLWGETLKDKTSIFEKSYPITKSNIPRDEELLAKLKEDLKESGNPFVTALGPCSIKEAIQLVCDIELNKYPTLLNSLCQLVRAMEDEDLLAMILVYQKMITSSLPDDSPEKIEVETFSNLSLDSVILQNLLFSVRQKLNEGTPTDLFHLARTYLLNAAPVIIQFLEKEATLAKEQEKTLQLPLESEKVQQLIAPLREKLLSKNRDTEIAKLYECYQKALRSWKTAPGKKELTGVEIKIVYVKQSNLNEEFVYKKKYP
ncbi:MAG TPA: hypothetical protein VFU89_01230 [Rhabdochlamydiaceae bacterium]|nr:hypothetical protein [Rhabdochlamydiaceae bacterium]